MPPVLSERLLLPEELEYAVVLFVDAEPDSTRSLREVLVSNGWELLFADSGPQAKQQLMQRSVDLVLLVVRSPGQVASMDSYELCAQLKLPPQTRNIPVVLLYPGERKDTTALSFMGELDADRDYRPRIYP